MSISYLSDIFTTRRELLTREAYKESGRIIMAYTLGYCCRRVKISNSLFEFSTTVIDYGLDSLVVAGVIGNASTHQDLRDDIRFTDPVNKVIIDNLTSITMGAWIARNRYRYKNKAIVQHKTGYRGMDRKVMQNIAEIIAVETTRTKDDYFDAIYQQTATMLQLSLLWRPVENLAGVLLKNSETYVEQSNIEELFQKNGFWKHLKQV